MTPDLVDLMLQLWRDRLLVALVAALSVLAMIVYLNVATPRYTATLLVTPAQSSGSGLSSSLRNLGGLASLAGVQLPQDGSSLAFLKYGENLQSRVAAERLAADPALMQQIFAAEWNTREKRWEKPASLPRTIVNGVKSMLGLWVQPWSEPGAARLQEYLERNVQVVQDQKRPLVTILFEHRDPAFAGQFLERLHAEVDDDLRDRGLARTGSNIAYITRKLEVVTVAEHRIALTEALGEQERARMTAESGAPFAAEPVSKVSVSFRPSFPRPTLFLAGALFLGLLLGAVISWSRAYLRQRGSGQTSSSASMPANPPLSTER